MGGECSGEEAFEGFCPRFEEAGLFEGFGEAHCTAIFLMCNEEESKIVFHAKTFYSRL